jgi:fatty-acyl-CoA synthase
MLIDPVATHARAQPDKLAAVDLDSGRRWTWRALDADVSRVAGWLAETLGPGSAARVATLSRNSVWMLVLQRACIRAGAIFVPFNWRLAPREIADLVADAEPAILFHDAEFAVPAGVASLYPLGTLETLAAASPCPTTARAPVDAPMTLLYTSGTSGRPKGVIMSAANAFWGATNFIHGSAVSGNSVFLCDMPLFHTAGLFAAAGVPILAGGTVLVSKGFDPAVTLARIANQALGITHYFSVPQMAQMLWNAPGFRPEMLSGLTFYATGGAPNPAAQVERFLRAGIPLSDGFGMSETCSNHAMPVGDPARMLAKAGSCGLPLLTVEQRIVDDDGADVGVGEVGELWLRGPSVTAGYWKQPELTARAFTDGWFRTGDAARCDEEGFTYLVDRLKDMYVSGGENVYPAEIEAAIAELVDVAECAVIGIADERWGEVGRAFIVLRRGGEITSEAVVAHCRDRLARYKLPATVKLVDELPRTASGKVQKHRLDRVP